MKILRLLTYLSLASVNFTLMAQSRTAPDMEQLYTQANSAYREFESIHGGYVPTDNVLMHYLCWGNPKNVPLIWSHGSFSHSYELADLAKLLTDGGYYLIAVDYYGHGQTPIPEKEVSLYNSADDIRVLMDSLKINQAIIGGFSRGGYIAAAFYQSYPERVKALILEDGGSVAFNTFNHQMSEKALDIKIKSMAPEQGASSIYEASFDSQFPRLITRVEFTGVEHNIHYEKPAQFGQELLKFLGAVQKQGLSFSQKK